MSNGFGSRDKEKCQAMGERARDVAQTIIDALKAVGHEVKLSSDAVRAVAGVDYPCLVSVDGVSMEMKLTAQQRGGRDQMGWGSIHYTGTLSMTLGTYPDAKNYPEPKAGFDVAKTVARIQEAVRTRKDKDDREAERRDSIKNAEVIGAEVQQAIEAAMGPGAAEVRTSDRSRRSGKSWALNPPAVTFRLGLLEAQAVATLLAEMRKDQG